MASDLVVDRPPATDGEIAVVILESARRRSWTRFSEDPHRPGVAELIVEQEWQGIQFLGDLNALDRLEVLIAQLIQSGVALGRRALVQAKIASIGHRFAEARGHLAIAESSGADQESIRQLRSAIDQACGVRLDALLAARRRSIRHPASPAASRRIARRAERIRRGGQGLSPRAARLCRCIPISAGAGVLSAWRPLGGEIVPDPQVRVAAQWYRMAIDYLPSYTKARVHLAEICNAAGLLDEAEALLVPMLTISDPEIRWRLADILLAKGAGADAELHLQAARSAFDDLLARHLLAFADHGAEFFAGSGNNPRRAFELARVNVTNRPTLRAFELAHEIALSVDDTEAASQLLAEAQKQWGNLAASEGTNAR